MIVDGAEAVDHFGGGLEATEERGDEDPMDRELGPELPTASKSPVFTILGQGWVPRAGGLHVPHGLEVVHPVAVPHNDDVLVEQFLQLYLVHNFLSRVPIRLTHFLELFVLLFFDLFWKVWLLGESWKNCEILTVCFWVVWEKVE